MTEIERIIKIILPELLNYLKQEGDKKTVKHPKPKNRPTGTEKQYQTI